MARGLEVGGSGSPLEKGGVVPFHWTSLERESGDVDPTPHVHPPPSKETRRIRERLRERLTERETVRERLRGERRTWDMRHVRGIDKLHVQA